MRKLRLLFLVNLVAVAIMLAYMFVGDKPLQKAGNQVQANSDFMVQTTEAAKADFQNRVAVIAQRPLFHGSRRPPAVAAPTPAPKQTIRLVGVLESGEERIALFRLSGDERVYRVQAGAELAAWKVHRIHRDSVELSENGGDVYMVRIE